MVNYGGVWIIVLILFLKLLLKLKPVEQDTGNLLGTLNVLLKKSRIVLRAKNNTAECFVKVSGQCA